MSRDKPEDHEWIPQHIFDTVNVPSRPMLVLYCAKHEHWRYQYGNYIH